ncbi:MAG: hypothetical protein GY798_24675 [Hyphomicrobiales bacterium]|nr:hypothetical protein [Hyphomicrobiales bacterium]
MIDQFDERWIETHEVAQVEGVGPRHTVGLDDAIADPLDRVRKLGNVFACERIRHDEISVAIEVGQLGRRRLMTQPCLTERWRFGVLPVRHCHFATPSTSCAKQDTSVPSDLPSGSNKTHPSFTRTPAVAFFQAG